MAPRQPELGGGPRGCDTHPAKKAIFAVVILFARFVFAWVLVTIFRFAIVFHLKGWADQVIVLLTVAIWFCGAVVDNRLRKLRPRSTGTA